MQSYSTAYHSNLTQDKVHSPSIAHHIDLAHANFPKNFALSYDSDPQQPRQRSSSYSSNLQYQFLSNINNNALISKQQYSPPHWHDPERQVSRASSPALSVMSLASSMMSTASSAISYNTASADSTNPTSFHSLSPRPSPTPSDLTTTSNSTSKGKKKA